MEIKAKRGTQGFAAGGQAFSMTHSYKVIRLGLLISKSYFSLHESSLKAFGGYFSKIVAKLRPYQDLLVTTSLKSSVVKCSRNQIEI